ncbi:VOC family protein [Actinomyces sp. oral taxon 448]|jgi:putative glyoxalase/bleomycin resistance protein/dioxygenase|uniref:VOC family protein n=1 Tax=Actinomyces sp. oral taxon 448 TaxID=712124 RepID=UPI0002189D8E|nr:VOC family protein [Actinomyces sp. oral taxon 448]EGQ73589.1 glyoxalase [Actinomyces sp. oral taxon 448 str. F0400]
MIDHISLNVSDPAVSRAFYVKALAPLGYEVAAEYGPVVGLKAADAEGGPGADLWLAPAMDPAPVHLALTAATAEQVDAFHTAALAAGGRDNGVPGERPHYHPGYYAAFVLDPDGNNLEVVCHDGPRAGEPAR